MATLPREAMQQAAQARAPQPGQPQGSGAVGQMVGLLDQAKSIALQPENFATAGQVLAEFCRNTLVMLLQLAKSKGGAAGQPAPAPGQTMSPSPAPMQPGAPAQAAPTPVGTR